MAFVAHARPEGRTLLDTHSCSLNKGIGWESRTRNEAGSAAQTKQSGFPKVAVFLKYCFPCRIHPACGENRSLEGLSWLREKAEAMRLCRRIVCTWMDKSEDLQTTETKETCAWHAWHISTFKLSGICAAGIPDTKAMVITIIVFLVPAWSNIG